MGAQGRKGTDMSWVAVIGEYSSVGTKLVFNMQAKISGAISITFSELLSLQHKGKFDPVVLLQERVHSRKGYVHMHRPPPPTKTRIYIYIYTYVCVYVCMNICICIQRESQPGCKRQLHQGPSK